MRKRLSLLALVCLALVFGLFTSAHAENGYTVEFIRGGLEYVLPGDTSVAMSEILYTLGLAGEAEAVSVSNPDLFSASNETGAWIVTAHRAFSTTEWMKVTINGAVYDITVTDDNSVSYIQRSWNENDKTVTQSEATTTEATSITSSSTTWGTTGKTTWYVVDSDVTISSRVTVNGTVNLILCDGFTLTASNGITVTGSNILNIYGQSGDTGALIAKGGTSTSGAGIGGGSGSACGKVNIYGGTIDATGSNKSNRGGAGIGGGSYGAGGVIAIYGGKVTATGCLGGAGIGGGGTETAYNGSSGTRGGDSGTITIYGGKITATGANGGAGIGGGKLALNSKVTICGGTINAGGRSGGAGIGTGQFWTKNDGDGSCIIVISGNADVKAFGSDGGAGIGSGHGWSSAGGAYDITIGGSVNVMANGSGSGYQGGAGIGGGSYSRGGKIAISGGTVDATGANGGAGIGIGYSGKNATTITIEGGTVIAKGSQYGSQSKFGAAIGLGADNSGNGTINLNGGIITTGDTTTSNITPEKNNIGVGNSAANGNYPVQINIKLLKYKDRIYNSGNYYGIVSIDPDHPLLNMDTNEPVDANNMPAGPSKLKRYSGTTTYQITGYSDSDGNSLTPQVGGVLDFNPHAGDEIDIVVTAGAGYRYVENSLTVTDADNNPVEVDNQRFEMPAKNVTLRAKFEKIPITYIAPNGDTVSGFTEYTPITSEVTNWVGDASSPKVYAVFGEVIISKRVTISDNVTLVLTDGAALAPYYGITVSSGQVLNICGCSTEETDMGALSIDYTQSMNPGIGGSDSCGSINICGGRISVIGGYDCAGIGGGSNKPGGSINISGGIVTATGGSNGAGIGGGSNGEGGTIKITGGRIEAVGGNNAMGIGGGSGKTDTGSLTVDFSSDDDSLKASSYTALTVENGKILAVSEGAASYTGTLNADALAAIKNKTLVNAYSISVSVTGEGGTVTASASAAPKDRPVTLEVSPADGYELQTLSYQVAGSSESVDIVKDNDGKYSFLMPQGNVTVTATFALHVHHFTYTADGSTITAHCTDGCGITTGLTLTISAPTGQPVYDGTTTFPATLSTGYDTTAFPDTYTVTYTKDSQSFTGAPIDAGTYVASVTVGTGDDAKTASVSYTIDKATPAAANFTYTPPTNLTYNGSAKTATVVAAEGVTGMGDVTVHYYSDAGRTTEVTEENVVNVSTYHVGITTTAGDNYDATAACIYENTWTFTITRGTPAAANFTYTAPADLTYDGSAKTATVEAADGVTGMGDVTVHYYSDAGRTTEVTAANVVNVDTYYVGITVAEGDNYAATAACIYDNTWSFAITRATPVAANFTYTAPTDLTYDGSAKTATVGAGQGVTGMGDVTVHYYSDEGRTTEVTAENVVNVDTYYVGITVAEGDNYAAKAACIYNNTWSFAITRATPVAANFTYTAPANLTYDGNAKTATVVAAEGVTGMGTVTVKYYSDPTCTTEAEPKNVGTYYVGITVAEGDNYAATEDNTVLSGQNWNFDIKKAGAQTIADVTDSLLYTATSVSESVAGKMPDDAGTLTYKAGTAAKTGNVTVSGFAVDNSGYVTATLSGGAAGNTVTLPVTISSTNYEDSTVKVKISLTAKDNAGVSITGAPESAMTYGDADFSLTGNVTNAGSGTGNWTWNTSDETVFQITSNGETATAKILKAGSATITAEYESDTTVGMKTTATITVNTKTVTIQAKNQSIFVGGTVPTLEGTDFYTVTGLVGEETLTTYPTLAYQKNGVAATPDNTTAGTYDIVPSGAEASANYTIAYTNGTLTISNKGTQTISAENVTVTYGETGKSVSATVTDPVTGSGAISYAVKSGDAVTVDENTGALTIVKAGSAVITVTAAETATYAQATKDVTVTVDTKAMTVSAEDVTVIVDGQPHGITVNVTDPATGYTVKYGTEEGNYTLNNSPTQTEVGTKTVYCQVTADNYTTYTGSAKVTINAKQTQTITAADVTATYGDTDKKVNASVTEPATGGGTISYAVKDGSADYIDVNASTGALTIKKVPADGKAYVTITAAETAAYVQAIKEVTVTINKANAAPATVTAINRTYDGTQKDLVTVDESTLVGGDMWYALGTDAATAPTDDWSKDVPKATDAGTWYVWYKVAGDDNHKDTDPAPLTVTISPADKTALNEAIASAGAYYAGIKDKAEYAGVAAALNSAIDAAKAVAANDNVTESAVAQATKAVNDALDKAKADVAAIDKQAADKAAAQAVTDAVNALPNPAGEYDKPAVEAARKAYDDLTEAQKKLVPADVVKKLTDAEAQVRAAEGSKGTDKKRAEDQAAAQAVIDAVNALPNPAGVNDKPAVEAARKAYDDLTEAQKKLVPEDVVKKLTDAEEQVKAAEEAAKAIDIAKCRITVKNRTYTGEPVKEPNVTVMYKGKTLMEGADYTVAWNKKAKSIGTHRLVVRGIGNFTGMKKMTFRIIPQGTVFTELTPDKHRITLAWEKRDHITRYQIQYSLNKDFSDGKKYIIWDKATLTRDVKELVSGETYYVRIRTIAKVKGKNYYSVWSEPETVTTLGEEDSTAQAVEGENLELLEGVTLPGIDGMTDGGIIDGTDADEEIELT